MLLFILLERWIGPGFSGYAIVLLAAVSLFIALGWPGYEDFCHRMR